MCPLCIVSFKLSVRNMNFNTDLSDIQRFYKDSVVFLTGGTGFIGKLLLEKILRGLPVKRVYVLVRTKNDVNPSERFEEIFNSPAFDPLKRLDPDFRQKVALIRGDCTLPGLGLSTSDKNLLINEVDAIFHCAATVRFDQKLSAATFINVRATRDIIEIAKQIKNIRTCVHVSTAYSNCQLSEIQEKIYEAPIAAEKLITACESLNDDVLASMTPTLLGEWPNTYTFTKQVAEDLVYREGKELPICIVRPSIVISTESEPVSAFIDNVFTLAGVVLANGLGLSRIAYYKNTVVDMVPADYVVNECIAAGWSTGESYKKNRGTGNDVTIYHVTSGLDNPISQDELYDAIDVNARTVPSEMVRAYPLYFRTTCYYNYLLWRFLFHTLIAYIADGLLKLSGRKTMFVKSYRRLHKFHEVLSYFMTREFYFSNENTNKLLKKMSFHDKQAFHFDVSQLNWDNYLMNYAKGLRVYLLKDPLDTLPQGKAHFRKLKLIFIVGCVLAVTLLYGITKFILFRVVPKIIGL